MLEEANGNNILIHTIKDVIYNSKGRFILLKDMFSAVENKSPDMPVWLQSADGQAEFRCAVMGLVSENIISPVGKKPGTKDGLFLKYRINKKTESGDNGRVSQIIRDIRLPASLDYYLKNAADFVVDRDVISIIMEFLARKDKNLLTVNERAYELFGDEKFFRGDGPNRSRGEIILKRLGLAYSDMCCIETLEPFFSFQAKNFEEGKNRKIFIIENRDTFWSFKRHVMDAQSRIHADMIIYGEGRKIISSFQFAGEYGILPEKDEFFYFGDLDAEGINIFCELKDRYPSYNILPFCEGYHAVLDIGLKNGPRKTPKQQKINRENIRHFAGIFDSGIDLKVQMLLEGGSYIPQEALSASEMKERFGKIK